jgi:hypothetical protein
VTRVVSGVGLLAACDDRDLLNFELWPRQRQLLADVEAGPRLHVWALGRRSGKTAMGAVTMLWDALLRPDLDALRPTGRAALRGRRRYELAPGEIVDRRRAQHRRTLSTTAPVS